MAKFKKGQVVYFYEQTGEYEGQIRSGNITAATKDLLTGVIKYKVKVCPVMGNLWSYFCEYERELDFDQLYTSRKQIEKEYKEEIIYGDLSRKLAKLEELLVRTIAEAKPKFENGSWGTTITLNGGEITSKIVVNAKDVEIEGIGSLQEEFKKLKKDVTDLKKKIKPKTKKPVVKEKESKTEEQTVTGTK